ncbi:peptidoglycan-associated lipoprotein [Novimethylophilus kurashikiensis]|uniref:Peptidoglycan-associated lipoprotein n=1 Tax=Novimethylophilus kurashikiensis TaxID=1825523 RepID=A0A2R5F6Q7_9PROT|nr:peptidoglycan-associated lipoprotein Pal [Novimethylophilus kurashikiensis]GBG13897.1 peptidoglycan-associated lipoprotein [Novimethylophilus kurashikiensis]
MNKQLIGSVLLAALLVACSSKQVKEEPKAAVEEKSPAVTAKAPEAAQPQTSTAQTSAANDQNVSLNPLKDPNNILSKRSIYFDFDKDEVKAEFRPLVEAHAKYLVAHPDAKVALQGNADDRGSREYNLALGQRRSVAVKKAMNVLGVNDKQIETVSYGEEKPRCSDKTEACWAENRRVDVIYSGEE